MEINTIFEEKEYSKAFEFVNTSKTPLTIKEIKSGEDGKRFFQIVEDFPTADDIKFAELNSLLAWFEDYYKKQDQKLRRLRTLGKLTDDGRNPYDCLIELYNEAEKNRKRIQELGG